MASIAPGNEIEVIHIGRVHSRLDGLNPRITDGPRRQARVKLGVIRGINLQIIRGERS